MDDTASQCGTGTVPDQIALFRATGLAGMLCAVPAFRAIRARYPTASISLLGWPESDVFRDRFPEYLDEFIAFPGFPGIEGHAPRAEAIGALLFHLQSRQFDLAIQMHGPLPSANVVIELIGARETAGFLSPDAPCRRGRFCPYPDRGSEVHRLVQLAEVLGAPCDDGHLEFPIRPSDRETARRLLGDQRDQRLVCIHWRESDSDDMRRHLPAVVHALSDSGFVVACTPTTPKADSPCLSLSVADVGARAAVLESAALLLTNDSGEALLAAAVGVPSITLADVDERWLPKDCRRHRSLPPFVSVNKIVQAAKEQVLALGSD